MYLYRCRQVPFLASQGFVLYTVVTLGADQDRAGKGVSQLTNSFDMDYALSATDSGGANPYPFEYKILQCIPNAQATGGTVFGSEAIQPGRPLEQHVPDSCRR